MVIKLGYDLEFLPSLCVCVNLDMLAIFHLDLTYLSRQYTFTTLH